MSGRDVRASDSGAAKDAQGASRKSVASIASAFAVEGNMAQSGANRRSVGYQPTGLPDSLDGRRQSILFRFSTRRSPSSIGLQTSVVAHGESEGTA